MWFSVCQKEFEELGSEKDTTKLVDGTDGQHTHRDGKSQLAVRAPRDDSETKRQAEERLGTQASLFLSPSVCNQESAGKTWWGDTTITQPSSWLSMFLAYFPPNTPLREQAKRVPASDCLLMTMQGLAPAMELWLTGAHHLPRSETANSQCSEWVAHGHVSQGGKIYCLAFCLFAKRFYTDDSTLINLRLKRWDSENSRKENEKRLFQEKKGIWLRLLYYRLAENSYSE